MKHVFLLFSCFFSFTMLIAQPVLDREFNMFRPGDILIKQQIQYKSPGNSGKDILWDFSRQKLISDSYKLDYFSEDGDTTLIGREHRTRYKYQMSGDSLYCVGYENPTLMLNYHRPELMLTFPFRYQSRSHHYFYGTGEYCRQLHLTMLGTTTAYADAYGTMILPEGDTLKK